MTLQPIVLLAAACCGPVFAQATSACKATSGARQVPVVELFTSEGCSSCPPADRWLSSLKQAAMQGRVVAQAFHVGYWDSLGWVDRFANPAHTQRQRQVAASNRLGRIYTPQVVHDGLDARATDALFSGPPLPAGAGITLERTAADLVRAQVTPGPGAGAWSAYWTVTEHGHASKVSAGENNGELLQHDFVVRQYVQAGQHQGPQRLVFRPIPAGAHPQQINLVVVEPRTGRTLQALSLQCAA